MMKWMRDSEWAVIARKVELTEGISVTRYARVRRPVAKSYRIHGWKHRFHDEVRPGDWPLPEQPVYPPGYLLSAVDKPEFQETCIAPLTKAQLMGTK